MSNLLSQASLVMIPSGYKEDIVYSQIPTNGSGDLSFTRASNGTRINSAGLVEVCPWNLATDSENFSANYLEINSTISSNTTTGPNGTTTAESILETTATDVHAIRGDYTETSGIAYTYSVYAKTISGRNIQVLGSNGFTGPIARVNLSNGTLLSGSTGASVESVGNGWYRISITETTTTTSIRVIIYSMDGTATTFAGSTSNGIYIWGAQLNIGSTAKPYFPTTDRLNVPRLTYQNGGGGCPSLLLEKQSTNLLQYSEDFTNAVYGTVDVTITANNTTSPDGTQNADKMTIGTATSEHVVYNSLYTTILGQYSTSVYLKKGNSDYALIGDNGASGSNYAYMVINLNNGAITQTGYSGSYTLNAYNVESVGNGWYRCSITYTVTSDEIRGLRVRFSNSATPTVGIYGTVTYTGNGTDFMYIWGAQLEASSYPTSYIPTTSSSATRVADECRKTGISSLIGQTEGTIFGEILINPSGESQLVWQRNGSTGLYVDFIFLGTNTDRYGWARVVVSGNVVCDILTASPLTQTYHKFAFAYKQNDFVLYIDGVNIGTDTNGNVPSGMNEIYLDQYIDGGVRNASKKQFVLFKTRLTNAELASLTTI